MFLTLHIKILEWQKLIVVFPVVRDMFAKLGSSKYEVLSVISVKDTFHSLRLTAESKMYFGILPYFGSASYDY